MTPKNLVVIMSDEHNARFMGAAGHDIVKTPNLDRLANNGTLFETAYCNSPICVPSRASFATGRYAHDCGYWDNADPYDGAVPSWGHRLMDQGHHVTSVGKLHYRDINDPNGFNEEINPLHVVDGHGDLLGLIREDLQERKGLSKFARDVGPGETGYTRYDREITESAVRWLKEEACKHTDRPWVLFVSFVCPHFPLIAPQEFYNLYNEADAPWPDFYAPSERPTHDYYRQMLIAADYDKFFTPSAVRQAVTGYLGLCSFLDDNIGQVLNALEANDLADDTRIIYTSDHGEALGKRGLWGKSTMFEESVAVPLIMAGPDIEPGKRVDELVSLVDIHPTIIEAVGAEPHEGDSDLPGTSLFKIAAGEVQDRVVFSEYHASSSPTANYMLRQGRYKLVTYVGMASQLFDLESDPEEVHDLALDPSYSNVLALLEAKLREICDPEETDRRARADQAVTIARHGGREAILKRGDFGHSPAPGQRPEFSS